MLFWSITCVSIVCNPLHLFIFTSSTTFISAFTPSIHLSQPEAKTSKTKQSECSEATLNKLDTWFTRKNKKNNYKMIYVVKNVRIPKYLDLEWFSKQGFNFPNLMEALGLSKLLDMKATFCSELVKVFYTYARTDLEGNLFSTVNGV